MTPVEVHYIFVVDVEDPDDEEEILTAVRELTTDPHVLDNPETVQRLDR